MGKILPPAVLLIATLAAGQGAGVLVIQNVTLIDGTGRPPMPSTTVVIEGDRFLRIGPDAPAPAGARVIDGTGKFLIPGVVSTA
jgi:imidazolonepropionase-like amidohydrolase